MCLLHACSSRSSIHGGGRLGLVQAVSPQVQFAATPPLLNFPKQRRSGGWGEGREGREGGGGAREGGGGKEGERGEGGGEGGGYLLCIRGS